MKGKEFLLENNFYFQAGLLQRFQNKHTRTMIAIYDAKDDKIKDGKLSNVSPVFDDAKGDDSEQYVVLCEDHMQKSSYKSFTLAKLSALNPDWCSDCLKWMKKNDV